MTRALGLDFGTTNTVLATVAEGDRSAAPILFPFEGETVDALRSALCFWKDESHAPPTIEAEAGPWAIQHYIDDPADCRFLQSMKTFSASPHFQNAWLYARKYRFEDLLRVFIERLRAHGGERLTNLPPRIVVGRPVTFAGASPDAELAMTRYRAALTGFGFTEILFVYEPVAAAFAFARSLRRDARVLVADFGGGTTDFSIMNFTVRRGVVGAEPLGHGGVGVAGDTFDYRIINHVVLPRLGKGTKFRSMGKTLDLPQGVFASFGRWNQLSVLKSSEEFRDLKQTLRYCVEPEKVGRFIDLVEDDQGYPLYKAVSAAKARLSKAEDTDFVFPPLGVDFRATIRRADFETWIADDLARVEAALDDTLARASLAPASIDKVFLTGGTSFVPAVRRLFERRFGADRLESGDELLSIANGLALIGERDDAAAWATS